MNISEAARLSGLTPDAIRFYERTGVLPMAPRASNGYRRYTEEQIAALRLARRLRDLDVGLDDVASVFEVAQNASCAVLRGELVSSLQQSLIKVEDQIRGLDETRNEICAVVTALEALSPADDPVSDLAECQCVQVTTAGQVPPALDLAEAPPPAEA